MNTIGIHALAVPLRTSRGQNAREHWRVAHKRKAAEKEVMGRALRTVAKPAVPCTVTLTRVGPSNGLDDDNLVGSLKSVRDAVAGWLGVDDRKRDTVRYRYTQRRGKEWAVIVEFGPPPSVDEALAVVAGG